MSLIYEVAHWVNGSKFTGSPVGAVDIYNPATGKVQGQLLLGSTDDLEAAIAAGSTLVRVGSGIFGARAARG